MRDQGVGMHHGGGGGGGNAGGAVQPCLWELEEEKRQQLYVQYYEVSFCHPNIVDRKSTKH